MAEMRASTYHGPEDLRISKVEVPSINSREILVRVKKAAVCGTDVRIYHGRFRVPITPGRIIGHEFSGDIVEVGSEVDGFKEEGKVTARPIMNCSKCPYCLKGRVNLCLTRPTLGYEYDGAFAEYIRIPEAAIRSGNLFEIPDNLSYEEGALAEPLAACLNGFERSNVEVGSTVTILGAGPIGLIHLQLAKLGGARKVIMTDLFEERLDTAKKLGASLTINSRNEDPSKIVKDETEGLGADVAIVAVGATKAIEQALKTVKKGGTVNLFGGSPTGSTINIDPNPIHYGELIVTGSSGSTPHHQSKALRLMSRGQIRMKPLITHDLPLERTVEAIKMKEKGEGLKHLLTP